MFSVIVNDKKFSAEYGTPLKEILDKYGMDFPCKGEGRCGQCRITCPSLPVTDRDKRFLSEGQINAGTRLACDKTITDSLTLTCPIPTKKVERRELSSCSLAVLISDERVDVGILDDELAESLSFPNPLRKFGDTPASLWDAYQTKGGEMSNALRAVIGKAGVEFFEDYGKAKAETTAICANEFYAKILLGVPQETKIENYNLFVGKDTLSLPTESIYFLPCINDFIGGDILLLTSQKPENSIVLDCENNVTAVCIDKEDSVAGYMWNVDYSPLSIVAIRAMIHVMRVEDTTPTVYLYGTHAYDAEEAVTLEGLTYIHEEKSLELVAKACVSTRFRSRLEKEKNRTSVRQLLKDEDFQNALVDLSTSI